MNHKIASLITVMILIVVIAVIGLFISQDGLTGAFTNTVACYQNSDCDDHISQTEDICRNPGTSNSICVNQH